MSVSARDFALASLRFIHWVQRYSHSTSAADLPLPPPKCHFMRNPVGKLNKSFASSDQKRSGKSAAVPCFLGIVHPTDFQVSWGTWLHLGAKWHFGGDCRMAVSLHSVNESEWNQSKISSLDTYLSNFYHLFPMRDQIKAVEGTEVKFYFPLLRPLKERLHDPVHLALTF